MRTGNGDRCIVILHQLTEQFGTGQHRNLLGNRFDQFRVVAADRGSINDTVDTINNIGSFLPIKNVGAHFFEFLCQR